MINNQKNIIAGIVMFNPDCKKLNSLIESLEDQVSKIIIYNNGFNQKNGNFEWNNVGIELIGNGENYGVAFALNELCNEAISYGASHIVTFDQDTLPDRGFVNEMVKQLDLISNSTNKIAAIGPKFIDARSDDDVYPIFQTSKYWIKKKYLKKYQKTPIETCLLITSGMLLDLKKWKEIGRFDDEYFIDYVDNEWCFRAIAMGYSLYACPSVVMRHELSDEPPKRLFGRLVLKYQPIRRYYSFRNAVDLIKRNHTPIGARLYILITLMYRVVVSLIIDEYKIKSFNSIFCGIIDGIYGKLGKKEF